MGSYLDVESKAMSSAAYSLHEGARTACGKKEQLREKVIHSMIHRACEGLSITDEQLRAELEAGGDLPDIQSGALTPKALRLAAETLSLLRYSTLSAQAT
jgi:hypothetical protein